MIEKPQIAELTATPTAFIHVTVAREKMPEVFGPAVQELVGTLAQQGVEINSGLDWASDVWECYVVGPESESDPANWRTELNRPLNG